ncbi:MAG: type II secretion system protein E [Nitrospirae bacterium GWD2_57_9]|nr:MAG: type II secretion system protein E [Nitrospirae bacterium GWD2_57_9]OGW50160.1 MAG: type II secretion system protein E [Nitrospirae bacterium GWC2_57_9]
MTRLTTDLLSEILLKAGKISAEQAREIKIKQDVQRMKLLKSRGETVHRGRMHLEEEVSAIEVAASLDLPVPGEPGKTLTEDIITELVARHAGLSFRKIDPLKLNPEVTTQILSRAFARRSVSVPLERNDDRLTIAVADPYNLEVLENIERMGYKVSRVVAPKSDILKIITEFYGFRSSVTAAAKEMTAEIDLGNLEQFVKMKSVTEIEATDKHIVNAVEFLFRYAFDQRASDIHIEPKREASEVRIRIDGMLHSIHKTPKAVHPAFVSRIKMLSRMDIAEKRRPQDGRIKTEYKNREVELRVSTMPTAFGEKVVIRIFDPDILLQDLEEIGFSPREYELFRSFIAKPHGIVLVTGPTGSGKTTTLYSALKTVATPEVNVVTIEDPIEMVHDQFNQVGVQPSIGVTFGSTLRTILRQDPDIIMVGEIRDLETAENAVQAALTGHLVFSTLHTNDAAASITRLLDLGVAPYLISSTVIGVMAQRLVRKICKNCEKVYHLLPEEAEAVGLASNKDGKIAVKYGEGCPQCRGTGYQGRTGIFEIMEVNEKLRAILREKPDAELIRKAAMSDGMSLLRAAAVRKMLNGETTFDEVIRVTGEKQ